MGVGGQQQAALYGVDQFRAAFFERVNVSMLGLPNTAITEARGIVGMDMFGQNRVVRKLIDSTPRSVAGKLPLARSAFSKTIAHQGIYFG